MSGDTHPFMCGFELSGCLRVLTLCVGRGAGDVFEEVKCHRVLTGPRLPVLVVA